MSASPHILAQEDGRLWVAGVVHAHTDMSDGQRTPEDLVAFAHGRGLGVVCITDHHFDGWRYRFGVRVDRPSVERFGIGRYLQAVKRTAQAGIGPVVLAGIEVMPHYRWEGMPPFLCCEAMKTGVVYGIEDAAVLEAMPMRLDGRGRDEGEALRAAQGLIDYIRDHRGLFFWSHLEEDEIARFLTARIRYRPRPDLLDSTRGYTGFGCFPHGDRLGCQPGGAWDARLAAAARAGTRAGPWVIGESDYHRGDSDRPYECIDNPTTVFLLERLDAPSVLAALAGGRMYAYLGRDFAASRLVRFEAESEHAAASAQSGQTLFCDDAPLLRIAVTGFAPGCRIRVVCDGRILAQEDARTTQVRLPPPAGPGYACRAEIDSPSGERVMTNPVFVASSTERERGAA